MWVPKCGVKLKPIVSGLWYCSWQLWSKSLCAVSLTKVITDIACNNPLSYLAKQKSGLSCVSVFHRRWLTREAGTLSCSTSENCGISASLCWITYCTPCCSPGRGVEHISSTGEHADGKSLLGIAKEAGLSKQGLELNVLQYGLVFYSLKFPTALLSIQLM